MTRCVAHLDMDAFYVSVELMRHPELRGKPVVVAGSGPRAVVTTASYEARKYGVFSAIPAARARRLCPEATFLAPDFEAYRATSRRVMERVRAQVETVEVMGLDEAYLDLTGMLSPRSTLVSYAAMSSKPMSISPLDVIFKPVTVRGFWMAHPEFAAKLAPAAAQAAEMIASGRMHIPVAATYPLSSIKEAVAHAERGGKILLDIAGSST